MAALRVRSVTRHEEAAASVDGWIDEPSTGDDRIARSIDLRGWVLAGDPGRRVRDVVVDGHATLRVTLPVDGTRDDVAAVHPERADAATSGFAARVPTLGLPDELRLRLVVRLDDGAEVAWAEIVADQRPLVPTYDPALGAIAVLTAGRSGSTWVMRVLGAHPEVLVHPRHPHEVRRLTHWMHAVRALTDQIDPVAVDRAGGPFTDRGTVGADPSFNPFRIREPELRDWLADDEATIVADAALRSIDGFYGTLARAQDRGGARYAEKVWFPQRGPEITAIARHLAPRTREVLLLRDPRDLLCSRLAFNRQRATSGFGVDADASVADAAGAMRDAVQHQAEYFASGTADVVLRYEALSADPHGAVRELCSGLGLHHDDTLVDAMVEHAATVDDLAATHRTTDDAPSSVGRWRRDLDAAEQALVATTFGDALATLGYD